MSSGRKVEQLNNHQTKPDHIICFCSCRQLGAMGFASYTNQYQAKELATTLASPG